MRPSGTCVSCGSDHESDQLASGPRYGGDSLEGEPRGLCGKEGDQDHHRGFFWAQELVSLAREMKSYASL